MKYSLKYLSETSPRLLFTNVAIETNDEFIVPNINFSAILLNYRNQKKVFKRKLKIYYHEAKYNN